MGADGLSFVIDRLFGDPGAPTHADHVAPADGFHILVLGALVAIVASVAAILWQA